MKRRVTGFFIVLITGSLFPLLLQAQAQAVDSPPSYVMKEWEGRIGTYWEYHIIWHPGRREEMLYQFGSDGSFGVGGTIRKIDEHTHELLQIFYAPDGSVSRTAHRTETRGNTQYGQSYTVSDDGTWTERRSYVWVKQTEEE